MTAINLLRAPNGTAQYVLTGSWGKYAADEARKEGKVEVIYMPKPPTTIACPMLVN